MIKDGLNGEDPGSSFFKKNSPARVKPDTGRRRSKIRNEKILSR
jgi:hypothetical protein